MNLLKAYKDNKKISKEDLPKNVYLSFYIVDGNSTRWVTTIPDQGKHTKEDECFNIINSVINGQIFIDSSNNVIEEMFYLADGAYEDNIGKYELYCLIIINEMLKDKTSMFSYMFYGDEIKNNLIKSDG